MEHHLPLLRASPPPDTGTHRLKALRVTVGHSPGGNLIADQRRLHTLVEDPSLALEYSIRAPRGELPARQDGAESRVRFFG